MSLSVTSVTCLRACVHVILWLKTVNRAEQGAAIVGLLSYQMRQLPVNSQTSVLKNANTSLTHERTFARP